MNVMIYLPLQSKLRASLAWLLSKVYGADVPREMQDPFYETSQVSETPDEGEKFVTHFRLCRQWRFSVFTFMSMQLPKFVVVEIIASKVFFPILNNMIQTRRTQNLGIHLFCTSLLIFALRIFLKFQKNYKYFGYMF